MTKPAEAPDKSQTSKRVATFAVIAAIIALVLGLFEYRRNGHLTEELANASAQSAQLQQQLSNVAQELSTTTTKLNELARKNLPISIIFRPSPSGNGLTTFFKNNAPTPIEIGVVLSNPTTSRRREVNLNIPANGLQSIGEAEGWVFAPGHHIQVTDAEFGTVDYVVPEK